MPFMLPDKLFQSSTIFQLIVLHIIPEPGRDPPEHMPQFRKHWVRVGGPEDKVFSHINNGSTH